MRHACIDHDCSHLCLLSSNNSYTCACPLNMELLKDQRSCYFGTKSYTLIIGIGPFFIQRPYQAFGRNTESTPKRMDHWLDRIEFNSLSGDTFYADNHQHKISVIDSHGESHTLIDDPHLTVSSMSFGN